MDHKEEMMKSKNSYMTKDATPSVLSTAKTHIAVDPQGNQHVLEGSELNILLTAFGLEGIKKAEEIGWVFR